MNNVHLQGDPHFARQAQEFLHGAFGEKWIVPTSLLPDLLRLATFSNGGYVKTLVDADKPADR